MKKIIYVMLSLATIVLVSCQTTTGKAVGSFFDSPVGKAVAATAGSAIVAEVVEANPALAATLEDLAANLEAEGAELSPVTIRDGIAKAQPKSSK